MPTSNTLTVAQLIKLLQDAPPNDVVLMQFGTTTKPCFPDFVAEHGAVIFRPLAR